MIDRIKKQEEIFNKVSESVEKLEQVLNTFQENFEQLNKYYGSKNWFKDKEAYEKGEISGINAGVLGEDSVWNLLEKMDELILEMKNIVNKSKQNKYKVITLCGSTRFKDEFLRVQKDLTLRGNIVISVGLFGHSGDYEVWEEMDEGTLTKTKKMLDDMHKRKIDMSDEIFVINVGGYIGESTRSEIDYAQKAGKKVEYLEK